MEHDWQQKNKDSTSSACGLKHVYKWSVHGNVSCMVMYHHCWGWLCLGRRLNIKTQGGGGRWSPQYAPDLVRNGGNISPIFSLHESVSLLRVILIPACRFLLMMPNMWSPKHVNVHAHTLYYVKAITYWASRDDCTAISRLPKTPGENGKRGSQ